MALVWNKVLQNYLQWLSTPFIFANNLYREFICREEPRLKFFEISHIYTGPPRSESLQLSPRRLQQFSAQEGSNLPHEGTVKKHKKLNLIW